MSCFVYLDIGDYINNESFLVMSPLYSSLSSIAIENKEIDQFYIPDKNAFARSRMTIGMMIDYVKKQIPFTIIDLTNIPTIKHHLDVYIEVLKQYQANSKAAEMLRDSVMLKTHIDRIFNKYLLNNPELKKKHETENFELVIKRYLPEGGK